MQTDDRIELERSHLQAIKGETLCNLSDAILRELGNPINPKQDLALARFHMGHWDEAKAICLQDPCDSYLACLSCLASAFRSPTIADSVLRDAARHTADFARVRTAQKLAQEFTQILG